MHFSPASFKPPKHGQKAAAMEPPRIYELSAGQCKYPTAFVDGEHRFCAAEQKWDSPYCPKHTILCCASRALAPKLQERV